MKATAVTVGGFANLAKTRLELDGILGLVSPNNYGKSNMLAAIEFAFYFMGASSKQRRRMMESEDAIPLNPKLANEDFFFEIEIEDVNDETKDYGFFKYGFSFSWIKDDDSGRRITDEWLYASPRPGGRQTRYIMREKGKYRTGHETRSLRTLHLDDDQLAIDVLTAIDDISINPIVRSIRSLKYHVAGLIDSDSRYHVSPFEFDSRDAGIAFDSDDIAQQLFFLKENSTENYAAFEEAIYTLFPEFTDFHVYNYKISEEIKVDFQELTEKIPEPPFRLREEIFRIFVKSEYLNQPVDINRMSAGTKRIIWLLTNTIVASTVLHGQILAVEEIETSIHPRALMELLEQIDDNLNETNMILTSHSPFLVQYLKPEKIYIGIPTDDGVAAFKRMRKDRISKFIQSASDYGMGFGEYLFQLMSAGADGERILLTYLEE